MQFDVDLRPLERLIADNPATVQRFGRMLAQEGTNDIVTSFTPGRSLPGQPPGVDTGALRASMRWQRTGTYQWDIMDGVEYGIELELGRSNMAARPFVNPAFERLRRNIPQIAQEISWV